MSQLLLKSDRFDLLTALGLAECSAAAYQIDQLANPDIQVLDIARGDLACVLQYGPDQQTVLVFRGTDSVQDWLTDLDAGLASWLPTYDGQVHRGFAKRLDALWPWVRVALQKHVGSKPLWVTGHSLGGALATLASARLRDVLELAGVYTFGSPRVGDTAFADAYDREGPQFRVVDDLDIIPHVPAVWSYRHVGTAVTLMEDSYKVGTTWSYWAQTLWKRLWDAGVLTTTGNELLDHMIDKYIGRLSALSRRLNS